MSTIATAHPLVFAAAISGVALAWLAVWAWCDERAERRQIEQARKRRFIAELEQHANHPSHRGRP